MIRTLLPPLTALAICASSFAVAAPADSPAPAMAMEQHWAADRAAMLDAGLAGLRAGLKLTPDQDKLWPPFEAAIRDAIAMEIDFVAVCTCYKAAIPIREETCDPSVIGHRV